MFVAIGKTSKLSNKHTQLSVYQPRVSYVKGCHSVHAVLHGLFYSSFILTANKALILPVPVRSALASVIIS
jgi:hypothetical protein